MADRNSKQKCYIYLKIPNLGSRENVVQQFLWGVSYWDRYYMKYCMYSQIQNLCCEIWSRTKHQVNSVRSYILLQILFNHQTKTTQLLSFTVPVLCLWEEGQLQLSDFFVSLFWGSYSMDHLVLWVARAVYTVEPRSCKVCNVFFFLWNFEASSQICWNFNYNYFSSHQGDK